MSDRRVLQMLAAWSGIRSMRTAGQESLKLLDQKMNTLRQAENSRPILITVAGNFAVAAGAPWAMVRPQTPEGLR
jgi:hypothetical protein